ncbi:MAG: hypothetical protein ACREAA_19615 [Candidatus Polarisedimenticolia bacterium]
MIAEPTEVYPEAVLEATIIEAIREILSGSNRQYLLVRHFGLDVAIFVESAAGVVVRLVETKAFHAQRPGGVGFGTARGEGPQVELLGCAEGSLALLRPAVRWVLADATLPYGTARYAWFDSETAQAAAMGGVEKGKQNNLRISALRPCYREWPVLLSDLTAFLLE